MIVRYLINTFNNFTQKKTDLPTIALKNQPKQEILQILWLKQISVKLSQNS